MTLFIILPSSNECKSLFNTRAFYCSERIFIVTNPYCVTGFDIIQAVLLPENLRTCFEPLSKQLKQTELFRNQPKQP